MNEHSFIRAIHRKLPKAIHQWKIAARFARGVPDAWYSGSGGDVWVEYKYISRVPSRSFTPGLTTLQRNWLTKRLNEGRNVAVVCGFPNGAVILRDGWNDKSIQTTGVDWTDIDGVVNWIVKQTQSSSMETVSTAA